MASQVSTVSQVDDNYQPILLTRSDAVHPLQSINYTHEHSSIQDKRKWDQVMDEDSPNNVTKATMQDYPNQLSTTDEANEDSRVDCDSLTSLNGKKPGRKPMADDDQSDDGDDPKAKRKAQNRVAQRMFRERKERYLRELESKLKHIQETHIMATNHLFQENHYLRSILYRLETENVALKGIHIQHGPLSGKPMQEWIAALQEHQQQFENDSLGSIMSSSPIALPLPSSAIMNTVPALQIPSTSPSIPERPLPQDQDQDQQQQQQQQQQRVQYTFAISTPATLRSRHQRQQRANQTSPPLAPKPQSSPIELVRLYPGEHPPTFPSPPASSPTLSNSSGSPAPTMDGQWFCDELNEEVCNFDELLSEPLFDSTTGGLTLGLPHLDDDKDHPITTTSSSPFGFLSGHEIWDRLCQHPHFQQYTSDQLLNMVKTRAKSTHLGPVLTEQDIKAVLDKMDHGLFA